MDMKKVIGIVLLLVVAVGAYYMFMAPSTRTGVAPSPFSPDTVTPGVAPPQGPRPTSKETCVAMGGDGATWKSCGGVNYCCGVCNGRNACTGSDGASLDYCACNQ